VNKPFRYQEKGTFFAQVARHLEETGAEELRELGARGTKPDYRGIRFRSTPEEVCAIVYRTRLCTRVFAPLIRFDCHSDRYLYKTASEIDWTRLLDVSDTFAVSATVTHSSIRHSKYAALRVKDAIADFFRERTGKRPSVDRREPDIQFHVHVQNNRATIHLDLGGGSLHRRGYRAGSVEAPMQETVAAAVIRFSGWDGERALVDPMCGSGTLLAEALMHSCRIPAGYLRDKFGFARLPEFDAEAWARTRRGFDGAIRPFPAPISGFDIDADAVRAARENLTRLPHGSEVALSREDFFSMDDLQNRTIIVNPPYGLRIGGRGRIEDFYTEIGDHLKHHASGSVCFLYAGKRELLKNVGLRTTWKKELVSGALDGRLAKYDLY
jgi:putative N6-adenine-specific DNA methylase